MDVGDSYGADLQNHPVELMVANIKQRSVTSSLNTFFVIDLSTPNYSLLLQNVDRGKKMYLKKRQKDNCMSENVLPVDNAEDITDLLSKDVG